MKLLKIPMLNGKIFYINPNQIVHIEEDSSYYIDVKLNGQDRVIRVHTNKEVGHESKINILVHNETLAELKITLPLSLN